MSGKEQGLDLLEENSTVGETILGGRRNPCVAEDPPENTNNPEI